MCFVQMFVIIVQCDIKEIKASLWLCARAYTHGMNLIITDCTSLWIFSDIYIDLIGLLSPADMKAVL